MNASNWLPVCAALSAIVLVGCSSSGDTDPVEAPSSADRELAFTLQILHAADMDGATGALDDVDNFSALIGHFQGEYPDATVTLSSGDNYIPGPRFFAASDESLAGLLGVPGDGRADMAFLNAMGFQASAVGNHELDQGTEAFAGIVATVAAEDGGGDYPGTAFPYLSANLDFSSDESLAPLIGTDGEAAAALAGKLASSATVNVGGETIGLVGATTPTLAGITSAGGITIIPEAGSDVPGLAAAIQTSVDALSASGIDKIILLAHMQQISVEQELAGLLSDVDVIIAGGSNTLLADSNDTLRVGDTAADEYPLQLESASKEPVLLVNVDGDYTYLGRLVVDFDDSGVVIPANLDTGLNGAWASTDEIVGQLGATPDADVAALSAALREVLADRDGNIVGNTAVFLDGRRSQVRTEETNLGNLTADANLWVARQVDADTRVSIKNGGGIRSAIGLEVQPPGTVDPALVELSPPPANEAAGKEEGDISEFDLQGALRFNNGLTLLTLSAAELVDVFEQAFSESEPGATPGSFPQVAGMSVSFDEAPPAREGSDTSGDTTVAGQRVRSLAVLDDAGEVIDQVVDAGALAGDPARPIRVVILDFLAKCVGVAGEECGDGYPLKGLSAPDRVDLADMSGDVNATTFADFGSEQDALAEYLVAFFADTPFDIAETPASEDTRIRNLTER